MVKPGLLMMLSTPHSLKKRILTNLLLKVSSFMVSSLKVASGLNKLSMIVIPNKSLLLFLLSTLVLSIRRRLVNKIDRPMFINAQSINILRELINILFSESVYLVKVPTILLTGSLEVLPFFAQLSDLSFLRLS